LVNGEGISAMRKYLWLGALAVVGFLGTVRGDVAPAPAAANARIHYDSQCYTLDGKDTFIFSGAFHYFRCPKPLWPQRFEKMKEAGLNCVETYVAWNWHEQTPPASVDDFSQMDMTDLNDWLDMAINRFGFYVIVRPGPYICAEWDGGGYPQWLLTKKPADAKTPWFRSDDPAYLAWSRHWYAAVTKTVAPWQLTHRPVGQRGVILWQIENEYTYARLPVEEKLHQLQALAHDSRDFGIDIPLITCMSSDPVFRRDEFLGRNVIECRNSYPGFNPASEIHDLSVLENYQPQRPRLVTELQGGWFYGDQLLHDVRRHQYWGLGIGVADDQLRLCRPDPRMGRDRAAIFCRPGLGAHASGARRQPCAYRCGGPDLDPSCPRPPDRARAPRRRWKPISICSQR